MKLQSITLLLCITQIYARDSSTLEYVLQAIECISGNQVAGTFSCVFYDLASVRPSFNNILDDLLKSPRLGHVVKYLVNGTFQDRLKDLPLHPSMLVVHAAGERLSTEMVGEMDSVLCLVDPASKVLVFVDGSNVEEVSREIKAWHFASVVYVFEDSMRVRLSNSEYFIDLRTQPHPKYWYSYMRRRFPRRNITFRHDTYLNRNTHTYRWVAEVAHYHNTKAVQYQSDLSQVIDIDLSSDEALIEFRADYRGFNLLYTNIPLITRILVPRDRKFHPTELMLMPFSWQLWIILVVVLFSAELCKHLMPSFLKNDPILFVVCGFERHNLHKAGHWERIILQALVVLMFFASNAYETKIISLMINPPSAQRIKTLEDAAAAGIRFYGNLREFPWQRNDSIVGKMLVDQEMNMTDTIPGVGMLVTQDLADISDVLAFDYERGQPWYVVLDEEFFITCLLYSTPYRSPFMDVFGYVHEAMLEAGIWNLWKRQYQHLVRKLCLMDLPKLFKITNYLKFDDMQLAWIVLAIGFCASGGVFAGEIIVKYFQNK